jgi:hypothetical protein
LIWLPLTPPFRSVNNNLKFILACKKHHCILCYVSILYWFVWFVSVMLTACLQKTVAT